MIIRRGKGDLNLVYRPCTLDEVYGHETIKNTISNAITLGKLPHALLFTGPSGCGKTTFARIIALGLNCEQGPTPNPCCKCSSCRSILNLNSMSVIEVDAGRTGDVSTVRSILDSLPSAPFDARYKVAIFDEAHLLGGVSRSEDALLKFLEDTPNHVYIILCTNYPNKLKEVTLNRCKVIRFNRLLDKDIYKLLEDVSQFEGYYYNEEVLNFIVEESKGVPRAALSYLQQIAVENSWTLDSARVLLHGIEEPSDAKITELCRALISGKFKESVSLYNKLKSIPLESIRMGICSYFIACLKNCKTTKEAIAFSKVIDLFENPYFDNPRPEYKFINSLFKATMILKMRK